MDIIANSILDRSNNEEQLENNNTKLINEITLTMTNFFDKYNPDKLIEAYISDIVPIDFGMPDILVIREKLLLLLKDYSDLMIKMKKNKFKIKKVSDN